VPFCTLMMGLLVESVMMLGFVDKPGAKSVNVAFTRNKIGTASGRIIAEMWRWRIALFSA
jgi:hypothetical protein